MSQSSSHDLFFFDFYSWEPEGFVSLVYAPQGEQTVLSWLRAVTLAEIAAIPSEGLHLDGLAMGGRGYLDCVELIPGWYYVDAFLPT